MATHTLGLLVIQHVMVDAALPGMEAPAGLCAASAAVLT
jgi:hypothetical protein